MGVTDMIAARRRAGLAGTPTLTRVLDRLSVWDEAVRSRWPFSALVGPDIQPGAVTDDGSRLLVRPAILGFIGIVAIIAGVSQQRSPFVLKIPGAWFFGVNAPGATPSSHYLFFALVAVYGGLVLLMRAWYGIIRTTSQLPQIPVRKLMKVAGLWMAPLIVAPPLFSRDVYSYVAQGEMMSHHISPYLYGPSVLGAPPAVNLVDPLWRNTPAPYGPLFMWIDGALTNLSLHHELIDVVLLRLLSLAGVALIAVCIPILARSMGRKRGVRLHVGGVESSGNGPPPGWAPPTTTVSCSGCSWRGSRCHASGQTARRHLAVLVGSGGEGACRGGHHLHRLGVDGTRDPLARPGSTTCDRRADLRRGHGRTLDRDRARVELGPQPGDARDGALVGGARHGGEASC